MNKSESIRQASLNLGVKATNKQVKNFCESEYGFRPSSQHVLAALGSERDRLADSYTGRELRDVKKFVGRKFNGDFERLAGAIKVVVSMEKLNENN